MLLLDKEDKFYPIKSNSLKTEQLSSLDVTNNFEKKKRNSKRKLKLVDFNQRKDEAYRNQKVKNLIDSDEEYSSIIKSVAVQKEVKMNLTTRFLNGKRLMFSKVSIKRFVSDIIDLFMFPAKETSKTYNK